MRIAVAIFAIAAICAGAIAFMLTSKHDAPSCLRASVENLFTNCRGQ